MITIQEILLAGISGNQTADRMEMCLYIQAIGYNMRICKYLHARIDIKLRNRILIHRQILRIHAGKQNCFNRVIQLVCLHELTDLADRTRNILRIVLGSLIVEAAGTVEVIKSPIYPENRRNRHAVCNLQNECLVLLRCCQCCQTDQTALSGINRLYLHTNLCKDIHIIFDKIGCDDLGVDLLRCLILSDWKISADIILSLFDICKFAVDKLFRLLRIEQRHLNILTDKFRRIDDQDHILRRQIMCRPEVLHEAHECIRIHDHTIDDAAVRGIFSITIRDRNLSISGSTGDHLYLLVCQINDCTHMYVLLP